MCVKHLGSRQIVILLSDIEPGINLKDNLGRIPVFYPHPFECQSMWTCFTFPFLLLPVRTESTSTADKAPAWSDRVLAGKETPLSLVGLGSLRQEEALSLLLSCSPDPWLPGHSCIVHSAWGRGLKVLIRRPFPSSQTGAGRLLQRKD